MKNVVFKFTQEAWSGYDKCNQTGNTVVKSNTGVIICEMTDPINRHDNDVQYELALEERKANELLIRHSVAVIERLNNLYDQLKLLKEGKQSIFDFNIGTELELTERVLVRATKID